MATNQSSSSSPSSSAASASHCKNSFTWKSALSFPGVSSLTSSRHTYGVVAGCQVSGVRHTGARDGRTGEATSAKANRLRRSAESVCEVRDASAMVGAQC